MVEEKIQVGNYTIYTQKWVLASPAYKLLFIHGMGEHSGRYDHLAQFLNEANISFYALDLPGHGQSSGKRGHIHKYKEYMDVIDAYIKALNITSDDKLVLMGHSMGGNLCANYLLKGKYKPYAAVIASPWLQLAFKPSFLKVVLAKIANRIFPGLQQNSRLELDAISRDPREVIKYHEDPLNHDLITPRMFIEVQNAGLYALFAAQKIDVPILIYHGQADAITSFKMSKLFYERLKDKKHSKFIAYPNAFHELHNEPEKDQVMQSIVDYLKDLETKVN